jgi:hypothetical protein
MMKQNTGKSRRSEKSEELLLDNCLSLVISQWGEGFCASSFFKNLSDEERQKFEDIAFFFTEMMFNCLGFTPQQWDEGSMEECCVYLFPEKISEGPEFFRCIVPVLSAFFSYLEEQNLQPHAGAMARDIKNLNERIMERSSDFDNWGMAKRFVMTARADGIDVTDAKAVRKYIEAYNRKVLKNGPGSGMFRNAPHDFVIGGTAKKPARKR